MFGLMGDLFFYSSGMQAPKTEEKEERNEVR
jgi:hypothetical protein